MGFDALLDKVKQAERTLENREREAVGRWQQLARSWRAAWTPGRIVVAGVWSGFLVGRAEPLSKGGGARWLQMLGTVSTMLASLRAAAASEEAGEAADAAADVAAEAAVQTGAPGPVPAAGTPPAATDAAPADGQRVRAPSPAEAATEISER